MSCSASIASPRFLLRLIAGFVLTSSFAFAAFAQHAKQARITSSFDNDWRFFHGDVAGAERKDFDDTNWQKLGVPHDWSLVGPVDEKNPTGQGGGFMPSGVGWYRKHLMLSNEFRNRLVFI